MKVNHFNTYPHGGAANAAFRIHHGLIEEGIDSSFLYRINEQKPPPFSHVRQVQWAESPVRSKLLAPIQNKLEKRRRRQIHRLYDTHLAQRQQNEFEVFSMARLPDATPLNWKQDSTDIVHLHWMAFMVDHPSFFQSIPKSTPIVWTLHDMAAFTGGCHYSSQCDRFRLGCGSCPQVVAPGPKDVSYDSIQAKTKSLRGRAIHVVAPSRWLIELAQQSPVWPDNTEFSVIHYGLDLQQFQCRDQLKSRSSLEIQETPTVIGFGADDLSNHRKGFTHLMEALHIVAEKKNLQHRPIELAVFGNGTIPESLARKFKVHSFGFVHQRETLVEIYSACDFVVVPSLEDNQPQVGLEAMACGRAVVGFEAGGIPEYVAHDDTGLLVKSRDDQGLASAILQLATDREKSNRLGHNSRGKIEREFEMGRQSRRYVELYRKLIRSAKNTQRAA